MKRASVAFLALVALALTLGGCATAPAHKAAHKAAREAALEWYAIGNAWSDAGNWSRAGAAYAQALKLDPRLSAASYNMIRALAESGAYDEAIAAANRLLAEDPANVRVLAAKGYTLYRAGRPADALAVYEELSRISPYAPDVTYNVALARSALGDLAGAVAALEGLVAARPEDMGALALYARVLAELGRRDEAFGAYEKLVSLGSADASTHERFGLLYVEAREFAKAMTALEKAVAIEPRASESRVSAARRARAWFALARLRLAEAEDGKGGLEALSKALEAGFADREAAAALLALPVLAEREAVAQALRAKGLVP